MTDDARHSADAKDRSDDHQQAVEASEHAVDALRNGDLAHAHTLLEEARVAIERVQHDDNEQTHRETAYDCYD